MYLPFPKRQILDSSKLTDFADDNSKFDENGRKFSKWVENTVGKGEIARYEKFLLFPQCFQKACFPGASKGVTVWEWVKRGLNALVQCTEWEMDQVFEGSKTDQKFKYEFCIPFFPTLKMLNNLSLYKKKKSF